MKTKAEYAAVEIAKLQCQDKDAKTLREIREMCKVDELALEYQDASKNVINNTFSCHKFLSDMCSSPTGPTDPNVIVKGDRVKPMHMPTHLLNTERGLLGKDDEGT